MDEKTTRTLARFLQVNDKREFTYFHKGQLVVCSAGDGTATVNVTPSPMRGKSSCTWDCSSPQELLDALHGGMAELCDEDDVDDTVEAFVDLLSRKPRD